MNAEIKTRASYLLRHHGDWNLQQLAAKLQEEFGSEAPTHEELVEAVNSNSRTLKTAKMAGYIGKADALAPRLKPAMRRSEAQEEYAEAKRLFAEDPSEENADLVEWAAAELNRSIPG